MDYTSETHMISFHEHHQSNMAMFELYAHHFDKLQVEKYRSTITQLKKTLAIREELIEEQFRVIIALNDELASYRSQNKHHQTDDEEIEE